MLIDKPLLTGRLLRRYKRFLADVELDDGSVHVVHCPNPGRMIGCSAPGSRCIVRDSEDPARKLRYSLHAVEESGAWIVVDTGLANAVVAEAIANDLVPDLTGYASHRREVRYGTNSRIDLLLEDPGRCYVEVKTTTLAQDGAALFPDAVTARGLKHIEELERVASEGDRAVLFMFVARDDVQVFAPADDIDPAWSDAFRRALRSGVEAYAWSSRLGECSLELGRPLRIDVETRVALRTTR